MNNEYEPAQKSTIEVSSDGIKFQANQSDYMGTIIWVIAGVLIILALVLLRWGPEKFKALFKNGKSKTTADIPVNGKARVDDITKLVTRLLDRIEKIDERLGGIEKTASDNRLLLEEYHAESEKTDAAQREQIKALERKVFGRDM